MTSTGLQQQFDTYRPNYNFNKTSTFIGMTSFFLAQFLLSAIKGTGGSSLKK
jgi:hypothetical protein